MNNKIIGALKKMLSSNTEYKRDKSLDKPSSTVVTKRNDDYAKNMKSANKVAEKAGSLGKGFGGEPELKKRRASPVVEVGKKIIKF